MVVSFVVVAYNAQASIGNLFNCLNQQDYPHELIEVILVDGNSADKTRQIMNEFAATAQFRKVVVLDNPKRTLPCGWNVALEHVTGEAVLRIDAHATMGKEFIRKNVANLEKGENISSGKVVSILEDTDSLGKTVNLAENSMFGGSFAVFRRAEKACYVSTAAFAMYRKEVFDTVGKYDERLARTEDNEMHYRMKQAGYKFYFDPEIVSYRQTRPSFGKLMKQKYLNGYWIGLTMGVQPRCFSLYHFVPFAFVLGILGTSVLAALGIYQLAVLMWAAYGIAALTMAAMSAVSSEDRSLLCVLLPVMFLLLHLSYGIGTLAGLIRMPFWKKCLKG